MQQETDPDLPVSVQEPQQRSGSAVACCNAGDTECSRARMGPFEGGRRYLHDLHHSLASVKQLGGDTAPPINRKLD